jgi:Tfp pilus assembly protein PilV
VPQFIHKSEKLAHGDLGSSGFILFEVLVAMSLIVSSWIILGDTHQQMILRLGKPQEQRAQMKKEADQYELTLLAADQLNHEINPIRGLVNEPSRVSRRPRHISDPSGAIDKK